MGKFCLSRVKLPERHSVARGKGRAAANDPHRPSPTHPGNLLAAVPGRSYLDTSKLNFMILMQCLASQVRVRPKTLLCLSTAEGRWHVFVEACVAWPWLGLPSQTSGSSPAGPGHPPLCPKFA